MRGLTIGTCTILVVGHLPSADNRKGLRSRDVGFDPREGARWLRGITAARALLRCFGAVVDAAYCPTTLRHASSARLLTDALAIAEPVEDARLNNIDYGKFKGLPVSDTPSPVNIESRYEGGEAWIQVAERWRSFCVEVLPRHEGKLVLLAGQSAAAPRMLRHLCMRVPLEEAVRQPVPAIPFFSQHHEFPTNNLIWHYTW